MEKTTKEYIYSHKLGVQKKLYTLIEELKKRADEHDESKLKEPEYSGWVQMDKEPRYPYGSEEYYDKMNRYKWLFDEHYKANRHHPEHWQGFFSDMDLIDLLEMLVDWVSYNDRLTSNKAIILVEEQCKRFDFPPLLKDLILNTLRNYICSPSTIFDELNIPLPDVDHLDLSQFE